MAAREGRSNKGGEVRGESSGRGERVAIYTPYATAVSVRRSGQHTQVAAWSLSDRRPITTRLRNDESVHIDMVDVPVDAIISLERAE